MVGLNQISFKSKRTNIKRVFVPDFDDNHNKTNFEQLTNKIVIVVRLPPDTGREISDYCFDDKEDIVYADHIGPRVDDYK